MTGWSFDRGHRFDNGHSGGAHVAVVGAGISGLAGAHRLRTLLGPAARITVFDRADRIGGALRTVELAGQPMDVGAEAFMARRPEVPALLAELGLTDRAVSPSPATPTIRAAGRTVPLPAGTLLGVPGSAAELDGLLPAAALARVAGERAVPLRWAAGGDRALGKLLRERFGDEVADWLVEPLLGGVYAGRVDRLGTRACVPGLAAALDAGAGSLTEAVDQLLTAPSESAPCGPYGPVFGALRGGYQVLLDALRVSADPAPRLGLPVRELVRRVNGWLLEVGSAGAPERVEVDAVLLAVPAPALRRLLAGVAPAVSRVAGDVELASSVVVALAYRAEDVVTLPVSSGVLIAADEPLASKAVTYCSRKWPHLSAAATDGLVRLRASLGRAGGDPDTAALRVCDDELATRVRADLAALAGVTAGPVAAHVQRWGGGLPQYGVGHGARVAELERAVGELPGLEVAGAMLHGVGVPACIGTARAAAERIAAHLACRPARLSGSMAI
ncbi:MAG: protoporphyrinogen oxidase [Pseudonocardia sp.]|nr:protoporphyrinogen oxidase [Pseudonocardia sp.]